MNVPSVCLAGLSFALVGYAGQAPPAAISNALLRLDAELGQDQVILQLNEPAANRVWADSSYLYSVTLARGQQLRGLTTPQVRAERSRMVITGQLRGSALRVRHELWCSNSNAPLEERITLENAGRATVEIADVAFGFQKRLGPDTAARRWVAVPFRRQADGKLHDYSSLDLVAGRFSNSDWANDASVADQELIDRRKLRSEGWAWTDQQHGLLIAKYNPDQIEYSVAGVERDGSASFLRFGGAGLALYREPRSATRLAPGKTVSFGVTRYETFEGDWPRAYELYRAFLEQEGHALPKDYQPPLNWNELFDVGWYHSNPEQLRQHYTREALVAEAAKARDMGCDLLYLDPGWEVCEGTTLWDEARLGKVADFARELRERFGLKLGYRTIGRVYRDECPNAWYLRRQGETGDYRRPMLSAQLPAEPVPLATQDGRRNLALLPAGRARASSVIAGYPELHTVEHLNDGYYNNAASWVSAQDPSWVEIDLGAVYSISEIALGSEHHVQFNDRAITKFEVRVATESASDSASWQTVFAYDGKPIHATQSFAFLPVSARCVRLLIQAAEGSTARIDELEIFEAEPHTGGPVGVRRRRPETPGGTRLGFWEVCTQCRAWQQEKLKRILAVTGGGVEFMMFDEFDWRGPCYDARHGHAVPSTPEGHVRAVYGLVEKMRQRYPRVLVEAHDPVWPWSARYLPVYFRQGFTHNRYQENWGFEFMWNPIEDLRSGRALCLYYYNLGCSIPLYDHITMEGDNDACLSFWWYASTVRHLGLGGKKGLSSARENERRYAAYKRAVAEYNRLRPFYARGRFIGVDETAHLHLHPTEPAAVVNAFNLTGEPMRREVKLHPGRLGWRDFDRLKVEGAPWRLEDGALILSFELPPLSPAHAVLRAGRVSS